MNTLTKTNPELVTEIPTARPAGLSNQCEEYQRNPLIQVGDYLPEDGPFLVQCKAQATRRLTLKNGDDVYAVKFCNWHHQLLRTRIDSGLCLVEILEDQELGDHR